MDSHLDPLVHNRQVQISSHRSDSDHRLLGNLDLLVCSPRVPVSSSLNNQNCRRILLGAALILRLQLTRHGRTLSTRLTRNLGRVIIRSRVDSVLTKMLTRLVMQLMATQRIWKILSRIGDLIRSSKRNVNLLISNGIPLVTVLLLHQRT